MEVRELPINKIKPNPLQPREYFDREKLEELAASIKDIDLLEPIIVRQKDGIFEIISGERRWKAAQIAGLKQIPAIIKNIGDEQLLIDALVENVHREDLTVAEKIKSLERIRKAQKIDLNERGLYKKLSELTGISESNINKWYDESSVRRKLNTNVSTTVIQETIGLPEEERLQLLKTAEKKDLGGRKIREYIEAIRKAPEPVRKEIIRGNLEPKVAERISEIQKPELQTKAIEDAIKITKKGSLTSEGLIQRINKIASGKTEMPQEAFNVKAFNKSVWNLERIDRKDVYTIGFGEWDIKQFVKLLKKAKIKTLVDVRDTPLSQYKPEFNKNSLAQLMKENDIKYIHVPELGVPHEIRQKLAQNLDYTWFFNWYDKNILKEENLDKKINKKLMEFPIAIMCTEFDPTKCHRHRIALALEQKGLTSFDL